MGIMFEVVVECDECGMEEPINDFHESALGGEATAKVAVSDLPEGWLYNGLYLCENCAEEEEDEEDLEECFNCGDMVDPADLRECRKCGDEYCESCGHECEEEE